MHDRTSGRRTRLDADFLAPGECLPLRPDHVVVWRGPDAAAAAAALAALL
ncbi:MAG: hypothetical protein M3Y33_21240 [Actinomycetota bacterium]|nr:hypothetical protein [Actinomycetota bacterium]